MHKINVNFLILFLTDSGIGIGANILISDEKSDALAKVGR